MPESDASASSSSGAGGVGPGTSGWTVDTAVAHLLGRIATVEQRLLDRIDLNDKRYEERWRASETALVAALTRQDVAVQTAFMGQEKQVTAALAAADRAVTKAEAASEKRFEGVNEFRSTLADQQRTLMPRSEVEVIINAIRDQLTIATSALTMLQAENRGRSDGQHGLWGYVVGAGGFLIGVVGLLSNHLK